MEKQKKYRSGYERYKEISMMIREQCSRLKGEPLTEGKTRYSWNGFDVCISDESVEIKDEDGKICLAVYGGRHDPQCQFIVEGVRESKAFGLQGRYSSTLSDSYLESYYQNIYSDLSCEKPFINLLPDDLTTIIQTELDMAEADNFDNEYDRNLQAMYISNLKEGLNFFRSIVELTKNEKTQEGTNIDSTSSQQTGVQKILEFMEKNGLSYNDLLLATVIKSGIKTSDVQNLQQALIDVEQSKDSPSIDESRFHDEEGK